MTVSAPKSARQEVIGRVQRSYPRMNRILVPLDFSGKSRAALRHAVPMADKFGGKIVLLHVLPEKSAAADAPGAKPGRRAAALKRLRETGLQFMGEELLDDVIVKSGKPSAVIVQTARDLGVDLIAITTEGLGGIKRLFTESTAELVLRRAHCAVLTVRKR